MNIYIFKNEQYAGPYTTDEVRTRLKSGAYAESDLAWYEGCGDPIPLSRVLRGLMSTPSTTEFSSADLVKIVREQKGFISTLLVWLGLIVLSMLIDFGAAERPMFIAVSMMNLGYGWRLLRALRKNPWIWLLPLICPFVCWLMDARLIWLANKTLKANGVSCGLFGAEQASLEKLIKQGSA